jgi:MFS family permease
MIFQPEYHKIDDRDQNFFLYMMALILGFYGISSGINTVSISLFLHEMGIPKSQIEKILLLELTGSIIIAPFFPKISEKYGIIKILIASLLIRAVTMFLFPILGNLMLNMICIFLCGAASFCALTSFWFWTCSIVKKKFKATGIALISVAFMVGLALGIGTLFYKANKMPLDLFRTSALFSVMLLAPIYFIKESIPQLNVNEHYAPPSKLIKYILIPIISMLVANYLLLAYNNFGLVYAIKSNVPYNIALLITLYMLGGNILFTIPMAFILDKIKSKQSFLSIILTAICILSVSMPFTINLTYAPMIIFGLLSSLISLVMIYSISQVSAKFRDHNLLASITILSVMHSIGGYVGISATKASVSYWGNQGLVISTAVVALFVLLYVINSSSNE